MAPPASITQLKGCRTLARRLMLFVSHGQAVRRSERPKSLIPILQINLQTQTTTLGRLGAS